MARNQSQLSSTSIVSYAIDHSPFNSRRINSPNAVDSAESAASEIFSTRPGKPLRGHGSVRRPRRRLPRSPGQRAHGPDAGDGVGGTRRFVCERRPTSTHRRAVVRVDCRRRENRLRRRRAIGVVEARHAPTTADFLQRRRLRERRHADHRLRRGYG